MKKINLIIGLLILPFFVEAQIGGNGVFNFLEITNSARVAGLGGVNISIFDEDLNMAYQNPALLNSKMNGKVNLNYVNYFTDISLGSVTYAFNSKKFGTFSAGLQFMNYGKFQSADATGIRTGDFTGADYAINLIWSKDLYKNVKAGVNIKPLYSHYEVYTSYGVVADLGITYYNNETKFATSFVLKNVGTQIKSYNNNHEKIPFDVQWGISKKLAHAPFRINVTAHHLYKWDLRYEVPQKVTTISFAEIEDDTNKGKVLYNVLDNSFRHFIIGVDLIPLKSFYASLAYNHMQRQEMRIVDKGGFTGFSWGFGVKLKKFGISFGRARYHLAGTSNHFSLYIDLSKIGSKKNVKVD